MYCAFHFNQSSDIDENEYYHLFDEEYKHENIFKLYIQIFSTCYHFRGYCISRTLLQNSLSSNYNKIMSFERVLQ